MNRTTTVTPDIATDAYSFARYGIAAWRKCTTYLLKRYTLEQTEVILRSKIMRWASDENGGSLAKFEEQMDNTKHDFITSLFTEV